MDKIIDLPHFEGYFPVEIPPSLMKMLGGDIFKLRSSVSKYNDFLKQYGEAMSKTEEEFHNDEDPLSWVYYTELSFMMPVGKIPASIVVKVETRSQEIFDSLFEGAESGKFKISLKGVATVSLDGIDNIDRNVIDISIKQVVATMDNKNHSSSPTTDQPLKEAIKDVINIFNPNDPLSMLPAPDEQLDGDGDDDVPF